MGSRVKTVQTCLWAGRARNLETGQPCPQCVLMGGDNYESENPWCQARNFSVGLVECSHLELWGVMGPWAPLFLAEEGKAWARGASLNSLRIETFELETEPSWRALDMEVKNP